MTRLLAISDRIDRLADRIGSAMAWLVLVMVVLGAGNAVGRHSSKALGIDLNSTGLSELQWYLFSAVFLLGAASALKNDAHVRVDVIFGRLAPRTRVWIDLIGTVVFLLPFCAFAIYVSMPSVLDSWRLLEVSPDAGGLPRYPVKSLVPLAFALLGVQGCSELIKCVARLKGALPLPDVEGAHE